MSVFVSTHRSSLPFFCPYEDIFWTYFLNVHLPSSRCNYQLLLHNYPETWGFLSILDVVVVIPATKVFFIVGSLIRLAYLSQLSYIVLIWACFWISELSIRVPLYPGPFLVPLKAHIEFIPNNLIEPVKKRGVLPPSCLEHFASLTL